jgi:DNA-binding transcriptional ArsR family regulator
MTRRSDVRTLNDAQALSAVANPVRSRLLDALQVDGPSTASALAERTGQAVGSISHHLKVLAEAKLIEEAPELARDRRERWWRLVTGGWRWSRDEFAHDLAATTAARAAESIQLQRQFERARDHLDRKDADDPYTRAAYATAAWLTVTPDELIQVGEELTELLTRWRRREIPNDGQERATVYAFARTFPAKP